MNKKWIQMGTIATVVSGLLLFNYISAASALDTEKISSGLKEKGLKLSSISASGKDLKIELQSTSSDKATPEDIKTKREIKNEARKDSNKTLGIKNVNLKVKGSKGNIIYDGTINDVTAIPEFSKKPEVKMDSKRAEEALSNELSKNGLQLDSLMITDSEIGGKLAEIVLSEKDVARVNDIIPEVEYIITQLNETAGTGIYQYNLSIKDALQQLLVYLSADLVYRDFNWWQSPILGNETWTKHSPKAPTSTPDVDEPPANPAPDPKL